MQISTQLRRSDGVRQGLEDMYEEQEAKALSPVSLSRLFVWSIIKALCPDSVRGTPSHQHAPQFSKGWRLPGSNLGF